MAAPGGPGTYLLPYKIRVTVPDGWSPVWVGAANLEHEADRPCAPIAITWSEEPRSGAEIGIDLVTGQERWWAGASRPVRFDAIMASMTFDQAPA